MFININTIMFVIFFLMMGSWSFFYDSGHAESLSENIKECEELRSWKKEYESCRKLAVAKYYGTGEDCIECALAEPEPPSTLEGVASIIGAIAPPLAYFGANALWSYQYGKSQESWADAYRSGHEACTSRFNSYLQYSTTNGMNPVLPQEASQWQCNGNPYGMYAGFNGLFGNGYGGFGNPYLGAGYSSGFMTGMWGPYFPGAGGGYGGGGYGGGGVITGLGLDIGAGIGRGAGGGWGGGPGAWGGAGGGWSGGPGAWGGAGGGWSGGPGAWGGAGGAGGVITGLGLDVGAGIGGGAGGWGGGPGAWGGAGGGWGGGIGIGGGQIGIGGGAWGGAGAGYIPGYNGGGSYWNNAGGWMGGGGQGNVGWNNQYQATQEQNMALGQRYQASMLGAQIGAEQRWQTAQGSVSDYQRYTGGYGYGYPAAAMGGANFGAGNLGASFSIGGSLGGGFSL
jgi:hypothetical protein